MSITNVRRPSFAGSVGADHTGNVGDEGETVINLKMKGGEDFHSDVVTELPAGTHFEVVEVGAQPVRIRVAASHHGKAHVGWISKATEQGQPLVKWIRKRHTSFTQDQVHKLKQKLGNPDDNAEGLSAGDICETVLAMIVREGEDFKSKAVGQMPPGTQFEVVEVSSNFRVKVLVPESVLQGGAVGWISSHTDAGLLLCKRIARSKRRPSLNMTKHLAIPVGGGMQRQASIGADGQLKRGLSPVPTKPEDGQTKTQKATPGLWYVNLLCCSA
jgi:hypothetical protein